MEGSFDLTSLHDGLEEKSVQSYARHISGAEHVLGKGSGTLKDAKINASWGCIICSAVVQCAKYCPRELPSVPDWRIEWRMQSHDARAGGDPFEFSFPTIEFCQKGERWNRGLEIFTPSGEIPLYGNYLQMLIIAIFKTTKYLPIALLKTCRDLHAKISALIHGPTTQFQP